MEVLPVVIGKIRRDSFNLNLSTVMKVSAYIVIVAVLLQNVREHYIDVTPLILNKECLYYIMTILQIILLAVSISEKTQ